MIFHKKKDAVIKLKQSNNPNLRLIQKDSDDLGSKKFYVITQNELYDQIKKAQENKKHPCFYESWLDKTNILFSLDIDAPHDIDIDEFNKVISKNISNIIKSAKKFYDYEYQIDNIIVLKTSKQPNKQSAHVIFRGLAFENHLICKNFFFRMVQDKVKLEYCDASIYGLTCLRTCYSTKRGKIFPLLPHQVKVGNKYTSIVSDYESELDFFVQTLITTIDELEKKNIMITSQMIVEEADLENPAKKNIEIKDNAQLEQIMNSLPEEYCNEYIKWNRVGMALFSMNEDNFEIFNKWSQKSPKYNYHEILKTWNSYKSSNLNKNMLGIGSLIYWAKEGGYTFPEKNTENVVVSYPETKIEITPNDKYDISYISQNKLTENLFKPNLNKKLLALQSEKGTGKTSNLIKTIFENKEKCPESILFISSRRTFGIKLSADLKKYGFKLYSEVDEHYIYDKRVIVQLDSLLRLQRDTFDLIIIDECESLARYITSSHFTKNNKASTIVSNLEYRINDAKNVIIMDADLSDRCMNYYSSLIDPDNTLSKNDIKVIVNKFTPFQDYTLKYMNYNIWLNELKIKLIDNKKIAIPMASNSKAKDLYAKLKVDFPEKNIMLIHKETSDEDKLAKLLKVNEIWVNYDVVIYTPTVCMGVSFDPEHFDTIFAYGCHNSLGAQEFCQMLHRVRKIKDNTIHISFDYYKFFDPIEDMVTYNQAEEMLCNDHYLTYNDLDNNLIQKKYKRVGKERVLYYPYKKEPIYDLYVRNCTEQINNKLNFTASFFAYVKFKNYQYVFHETDNNENILEELKEIKKIREQKEKDADIENMMIAKVLTKEEYKDKCMRKENFMTESDRYEIKKFNFMKNYTITEEQLTTDLIEKYNDRKLMLTYNNLSSIIDSNLQQTNKKLDILKSNQQIGDEFRTCYQDFTFKNKYTYHYHTIMLLEYCGFNINDIDNKENAILKEIMDENMKGKINNQTLAEYIETEKHGLYWKFECRQLINNVIVDEFNFLLKIVNNVINKQYGLKIRTLTLAKKIKSYYLTTNKTWDDLPNQMVPKNINEILVNNKDYSHIIDDLDSGLFIASDCDTDSDAE
jgi:hypothetical protein